MVAGILPANAMTDSRTLHCAAAAALVQRQGAVVLATGPYTFDRFVTDAGKCVLSEYLKTATVPTLDNLHCPVGFVCTGNGPQKGGS
jgi:hypothetical protein